MREDFGLKRSLSMVENGFMSRTKKDLGSRLKIYTEAYPKSVWVSIISTKDILFPLCWLDQIIHFCLRSSYT